MDTNNQWNRSAIEYFKAKAEGSIQFIDDFFGFWKRCVKRPEEDDTFGFVEIRPYWEHECGRQSVMLRKGRSYGFYAPVCDIWSCTSCYFNLRRRWVGHLGRIIEGLNLYVLVCGSRRWQSIQNAAANNDFNYIAVQLSGGFVVAMTKPMRNAIRVSEKLENLVEMLTSLINGGQELFVSPDWQLRLKTIDEQINDFLKNGKKLVLRTRLPSTIQWRIAESLGAVATSDDYVWDWMTPDIDQTEWVEMFVRIVREYEEYVFEQAMREDEVTTQWTLMNLYYWET